MGSVATFLPSVLFTAAFSSAVFFQGFYTDFLSLTLIFLSLGLLFAVWMSHQIRLPLHFVSIALALYVLALISGAWVGRVAISGFIHFFWALLIPLTCALYLATPGSEAEKERVWSWSFGAVTTVCALLGLYVSYEWLILGAEPKGPFLNRHALGALLNLVGLPLCALFLARDFSNNKRFILLIGLALLVLAFTLAELKGRGALLSGLGGLLIVLGVGIRHVSFPRILSLLSILIAAFLLATTFGQVELGSRMATLASPHEAGWDRILIWENSWRMLQDAPWYGLGLGHYAIYWPQYRDPRDTSAGFLAHNDYLQMWIEAGYPGLISLILVLVSVGYLYWRIFRSTSGTRLVEATGLFAGLAAIGAHALVDFSLNVAAVQVAGGLILGRLLYLGKEVLPTVYWQPHLPSFISGPGLKFAVSLVLLIPLAQFVFLFASSVSYREGLDLAARGELVKAYETLGRSARWYPGADNAWMSTADLARQIIASGKVDADLRRDLYTDAMAYLDRAESINPYRWQTLTTRGKLIEANPDLAGEGWYRAATDSYRRTLQVDPRAYLARYRLAALLLRKGETEEAVQVLEKGIVHYYRDHPSLVPYLALTAEHRGRSGDLEGQKALVERIQRIMGSQKTDPSMG